MGSGSSQGILPSVPEGVLPAHPSGSGGGGLQISLDLDELPEQGADDDWEDVGEPQGPSPVPKTEVRNRGCTDALAEGSLRGRR